VTVLVISTEIFKLKMKVKETSEDENSDDGKKSDKLC
jgi:hypothetical protein